MLKTLWNWIIHHPLLIDGIAFLFSCVRLEFVEFQVLKSTILYVCSNIHCSFIVESICQWLVDVVLARYSNFRWDNADQIINLSSLLEEVPNVSLSFAPRFGNFVAHWVASNKNVSLPNSWKVYTPKLSFMLAEDFVASGVG